MPLPFFILAFWIGLASCQSSITLWEFGANRLLTGKVTLPMLPVGVATDAIATTYLYEIAESVVTTTANGAVVTLPIQPGECPYCPLTATRTIVASASGWVENFVSDTIQCNFINATVGECSDTASTSFGKPTPIAVAIAASATSSSVTLFQTVTSMPTQTSVGAPIITSTAVASATSIPTLPRVPGDLLCALLILMVWLLRRKRQSHQESVDFETPSAPVEHARELTFQNLAPLRSTDSEQISSAPYISSLAETTSDDSERPLQPQSWKGRLAREEHLQALSISTPSLQDDNSHYNEQVVAPQVADRMVDILERLRRLEEQGEPPPNYG
ncbi:hypothetical protein BT96DRAFT_945757 [Gymnopus androsaceus JB14]|uniref:Uncharacterized protein n=1 Tax=Gymnopus androsaceus JB14 TaxID=1447944 RepID=A0A6A4H0N7_9AGAR|nr:hypothetical protein BT96DRAFT_945757 [Gymnopus androsaceus JB14]